MRNPVTRSRPLARAAVLAGLAGVVILFVAWTSGKLPKAHAFHTAEELELMRGSGNGLPGGSNNYFMASGTCAGCHGHDVQGFAMVDEDGVDVNVTDDWRSTMMANSAHDPFWRAKVSHEVQVNPGHQAVLEDKCTSCHAPQGRHNKFLSGGGHYSIAEMMTDPVALDGVSCVACHMQAQDSLGFFFSGEVRYDTNDVLYGPYGGPNDPQPLFGAPMTSFVGFEPLYGEHVSKGEFCASCHTLITGTVDLNGNSTGGTFVEQATYHEWVNSVYDDNVSCQACHVPRIDDAVVISANYLFLQGRSPYGLHHFAGANSFMLELLKNNMTQLALTADSVHFDSTIARTLRMLQVNSLLLDAEMADRSADTAFIDVRLTNLAGHKFPSGYPARRAFVELLVLDAMGDTLFKSGRWGSDYSVEGHDAEWEPHYDVIRSPDEVQIYEMVMGDVNGDKTTVLERADSHLKDNRLVPEGFSTSHISYDTTQIVGVPVTDLDFNRDDMGVEGSGTDIVHYHVPMNGYTGLVSVEARVWYQSAPPRWMEEMFAFNSAEIDSFRIMYKDADGSPVLVREVQFTDLSVGVDDVRELGVHLFPNPVRDGILRIRDLDPRIDQVTVHDARGALVASLAAQGQRSWDVRLPAVGTYLVTFTTNDGRRSGERIVYLR